MADKKTLFIDNREIEFDNEKTVLEVAKRAGIEIPTFCHRPDLTQFGACRICVVEVEGRGIQASCTMPPRAGLKIHTNSLKVRKIRKTILELLLANHNRECTTCDKSGYCELQKYAMEYNIQTIPYEKIKPEEFVPIDNSSVSVSRDMNKCILCGACVRACNEFQGIGVLGFADRGSNTKVQPVASKPLKDVNCVNCGQCAAVCPTGALTIKSDIDRAYEFILNPKVKTVLQIAPSVRVALGEMFNLKPGENTIKKIYTAARMLGFDLIFDTNFSADLTIMEEANEFVERLNKNENLPLFTSCCPAWVRYLELNHPDMLNHLSSAKSPQGMMSSVIKEFAPKYYEGFEDVKVISLMPCTAKKYEASREELKNQTDCVLTTFEFAKMIKCQGIDLNKIEESEANSPFGGYSGAGTIFGASGGVAEAALRTAYNIVTNEELENVDVTPLRGVSADNRSKEAIIDIKGKQIKIRVVSTLKEAEIAIREVKSKKADFQLLEVMACPGGCINGGGQPISCMDSKIKEERAIGLYEEDKNLPQRKSHKNPDIIKLYNEHFEKPGSHLAHKLLHTTFSSKKVSK